MLPLSPGPSLRVSVLPLRQREWCAFGRRLGACWPPSDARSWTPKAGPSVWNHSTVSSAVSSRRGPGEAPDRLRMVVEVEA